MDATFFATPAELRAWLEQHHAGAEELLIGFYKVGSGRPSITYQEALDQALCYGWIDGVRRRIDDSSYSTRFTPRRKGSTWSAVNIKRVGELTAQGLMQSAGLAAFEARQESKMNRYSNEQATIAFDADLQQRFQAHPAAWDFFQSPAAVYRRTATWWVISAKKEETPPRRLATLIGTQPRAARLAKASGTAPRSAVA